MNHPPFTAVFQAQFPGWGRDSKPVKHRKLVFNEESRKHEPTGDEYVCDMAAHTLGGTCMTIRYSHCGPVGIDRKGGVWLLVEDFTLPGDMQARRRWRKYPAKADK